MNIVSPTVELLAYTPDPEKVVAVAAKCSYAKRPIGEIWKKIGREQVKHTLHEAITHGHLSVLEHASFTFAIQGVSRVLSHQLVRHRIGSYVQQSQQRVGARDFSLVVPPEIERDSDLVAEFQRNAEDAVAFYERALTRGVRRGVARYALPNACTTQIVMTMNARSLFNLIAQRTCGVEEWEFRDVATKMHEILLGVAPNIFKYAGPRCVTDLVCLEGERGERCGRYKTIPGATLRNGFREVTAEELVESRSLAPLGADAAPAAGRPYIVSESPRGSEDGG